MEHKSFSLELIEQNLVEIVVNDGVEVSLEDFEAIDSFFNEHCKIDFGVLVNRKNNYSYSFEAKHLLGLNENIKAIAVNVFTADGYHTTQDLIATRRVDNLNIKVFTARDNGRDKAVAWLSSQVKSLAK